ncbi:MULTISPECIES: type II toxin-antitoxin system RelE/ParE family toxin [Pseudomonas]|jgi:putative addiction module killer protein|uniref:Type II toxin-antitoxin system RelE/ParE family toxin n=3 Tax=Pseudomonas putida TaxID=303 RepID=A0ABD7BBC6_PSEPU|nr:MULTISPECIES: type II toxin-antitoxin system RelE/ParE family toxin [Pseudomonas]AGN83196.1 addiction module antitoxin RelB [Pseudomonas putida H8234]EKT4451993.1 type II toxin-antitoxin system RelE/ParE family toxin [Pseudomonas putida]EKT4463473.1 type II toxin-antitoxin system RelE/ParE family toxin [Pseudomonas putida]EKT4556855.1 type II toxin-antitoxin system RelE/ParE family toxin [Pseudomonas putida]EKT4561997.1 type II toxin-antitoxin system RelE/ParE family toxin [Pseudomonas puti
MKKIESSSFRHWVTGLRDLSARARIISRINRLMEGLPGDVSPVGHGVSELKIHYGPGYRVYFHQTGSTFVILLCGGDKSSQKRDIKVAHQILRSWRMQND